MRLALIAVMSFTIALLNGCAAQDDHARMRESGKPKGTTTDGSLSTGPRYNDERQGSPAYSRDPTSEGRRSPGLP